MRSRAPCDHVLDPGATERRQRRRRERLLPPQLAGALDELDAPRRQRPSPSSECLLPLLERVRLLDKCAASPRTGRPSTGEASGQVRASPRPLCRGGLRAERAHANLVLTLRSLPDAHRRRPLSRTGRSSTSRDPTVKRSNPSHRALRRRRNSRNPRLDSALGVTSVCANEHAAEIAAHRRSPDRLRAARQQVSEFPPRVVPLERHKGWAIWLSRSSTAHSLTAP